MTVAMVGVVEGAKEEAVTETVPMVGAVEGAMEMAVV